MAQKQQQYESAADSIFNFIFTGARRNMVLEPPKNLKNIGGDEMAYALGEIALTPAVYANEELLHVLSEPLNTVNILEVESKLDKKARSFKIGVSLGNLSEFATDPESVIEKSWDRSLGARKQAKALNRVRGFGGIIDLGIGAVAAKAAGYSSREAIQKGWVVANEWMDYEVRNNTALELAASASAFEAGANLGWDYYTTEKISKSFAAMLDSSYNKVDFIDRSANFTLAQQDTQVKTVSQNMLRKQGFNISQPEFDELFSRYRDRRDKYVAIDKDKGAVKIEHGEWNLGEMNKSILKKQASGINYDAGPDEWMNSQSPADKLRALQFEELQAKINILPPDDPKRATFQRDLNFLYTWQLSNGKNMKWSRFLGEAYTNLTTLNQYVLQGGGLAAVLSGDFFDNRKNNLAPSKLEEVKIYAFDDGAEKVEIVIPRDDMNRPYATVTGLYYLTPRSLIRTFLVNGEGFVYSAYRRQEKMRNMIKGSDSLYNFVQNYGEWAAGYGGLGEAYGGSPFSTLLSGVAVEGNQQGVLNALAEGGNYQEVIRILEEHRSFLLERGMDFDNPELIGLLEGLKKYQGKIKNSFALKYAAKLRNFFNKISPQQLVQRIIRKTFVIILGKKLGARAMKWIFNGAVALKTLVRRVVKKAIHAISQSLGLAIGGVANALIYVLTEALYFVAEKLLKPVLKVVMFFVWGIPLLFLFMILSAFSFLNSFNLFSSNNDQVDTASSVAPIFCEECVYGSSDDLYPYPPDENADGGDNEDDGSPPPPEMSDVECPLLPSENIRCSQGPYRGISHGKRNAIDVPGPPPTFWYAPSDGVVTRAIPSFENSRIPGQLCGGIVNFHSSEHGVTYVIVHVVPYVSLNQEVKQGEPIAKMAFASDGNINFRRDEGTCATGPHFHLEIIGTGVYADRYYREFLNCDLGTCP